MVDQFYQTAHTHTVISLEKFGYGWNEGRIHPECLHYPELWSCLSIDRILTDETAQRTTTDQPGQRGDVAIQPMIIRPIRHLLPNQSMDFF